MEEELETPETQAENPKAGEMVRAARKAAGMDTEKLSAMLRISPAALEAIEACQYDRLPGDPYVRATLGSLARSLDLDSGKLLRAYNSEIGNKHAELPVKPYADTSQIHILAHRKLFIGLLAVLLIALLFIFGKVNSSSEKNTAPVTSEPRNDTVAVIAPPPDTVPESAVLQPDSLSAKTDSSVKVAAKKDTAHAAAKIEPAKSKADSAAKAAAVAKTEDSTRKTMAAQPGMNRVTVKPLVDSVWMRVLRNGKPESIVLLLLAKPPVEVAHNDTIVLILGKRRSVELTLGDTTFVPSRKRFKLFGKKITYF